MKNPKHFPAAAGFILLSCIVLLTISCGTKLTGDVTEYLRYIDDSDNGLILKKEQAGILFSAQYRPAEYMAMKELGASATADGIKQRTADMSGGFTISFKIMDVEGKEDIIKGNLSPKAYLDRITHMTGPIQHDFMIVSDSDTIPCAFSHFERAYNITPYNEILLGFETEATDSRDKKLLYHDQLFGLGWISFTFRASDLKNIPELTLQQNML